MKLRVLLCGLALFGTLTLGPNPARSDDKQKADDKKQPGFDEYLKLAQPGPEHKRLDVLAGSWDATVKFWLEPGKPPTESSGGVIERKWILGDRYLQEDVTGKMFGMPFRGLGLTGYDNMRKKYTGAWVDNMGTGIMHSLGDYDADKKTFRYVSDEIDPLTKKAKKVRSVIRILGNDKHVMEMYEPGPGGKEVRTFEMTCTRKKKSSAK